MLSKVIHFIGLSLLILSASCASVPDAATAAKLLALHNAQRAEIGLASLTWSADLASSAQKWANNLATNGGLKHSGTKGVGENLAKASFRKNLIEFLFGMWSNEKKYFDSSKPFPQCSTTGNWGDVAHYTQIIWSKTYAVGCGIANTTASSVLVCQYKLAGNYKGNYVYLPSDIIETDPEPEEDISEEEAPVGNDDNVDDDSSEEEAPVDDNFQGNDDSNNGNNDDNNGSQDDEDSQGNDDDSNDDSDSDSNEPSSSSPSKGTKKTYTYKKTYTRAYSYSTKKKN